MPARCRLLPAGTILFLLVFLAPARGAEFSLASRTLLQISQEDTREEMDDTVVPAYQYLQLGVRDARVPGLSFHLYGWGRADFADSARYDERTEGELIYGYVEYLSPDGPIRFRAGRTTVFEGVANESVDGVAAVADLTPAVTLSAYAGQPVSLATRDGRSGDALYGGRLSWRRRGFHEAGLSYKHLRSDGTRDEERLGADVSLTLPGRTTLLGTSTYNLVEEAWGEHFYEARWHGGPFEVRPFYQRFRLDALFSEEDNSATPFRVLARVGGTTEILGTEGYWYPGEATELGVRVKRYNYSARFDDAWYFSALATYKWKIFSQVGAELGRMQGGEDFNRFSLVRGYTYVTFPRGFLTGDVFYTRYDESIFNEHDALFLSAGAGRAFLRDALKLKLSLSYSDDPLENGEIRTTLIAEYAFP